MIIATQMQIHGVIDRFPDQNTCVEKQTVSVEGCDCGEGAGQRISGKELVRNSFIMPPCTVLRKEERITLCIAPAFRKILKFLANPILSPETGRVNMLVLFVPSPVNDFGECRIIVLSFSCLIVWSP